MSYNTPSESLRAPGTDMASKHGSRLMSAALEVRQKIYVDVFSEANINCLERTNAGHGKQYDDEPAGRMSVERWAKHRGVTVVPDDKTWCFEASQMHVNVLRVSKQTYCEALPVLESATHLKIFYPAKLEAIPWCIERYFGSSLERLTLTSFFTTGFPWIDASRFPKLRALSIWEHPNVSRMPQISIESSPAVEAVHDSLFGSHDSKIIQSWFADLAARKTSSAMDLDPLHIFGIKGTQPDSRLKICIRWCYIINFIIRHQDTQVYRKSVYITLKFDLDSREVLSRTVFVLPRSDDRQIKNKEDIARWLMPEKPPRE